MPCCPGKVAAADAAAVAEGVGPVAVEEVDAEGDVAVEGVAGAGEIKPHVADAVKKTPKC